MVCPFAIGKAFGLAAATRIGLKYEKLSRNRYEIPDRDRPVRGATEVNRLPARGHPALTNFIILSLGICRNDLPGPWRVARVGRKNSEKMLNNTLDPTHQDINIVMRVKGRPVFRLHNLGLPS